MIAKYISYISSILIINFLSIWDLKAQSCCDGLPVPAGFKCCSASDKQSAQDAYKACEDASKATALAKIEQANSEYQDCLDESEERRQAGMEVVDSILNDWIAACQNAYAPPEDIVLVPACIYAAHVNVGPLYAAVWATYWAQYGLCALDRDAKVGLANGQLEIDLAVCQAALNAACDNW